MSSIHSIQRIKFFQLLLIISLQGKYPKSYFYFLKLKIIFYIFPSDKSFFHGINFELLKSGKKKLIVKLTDDEKKKIKITKAK